ncbi:MAG: hypothetical protein ACLVHV_14925 [Oscillospiraceae bacterium]
MSSPLWAPTPTPSPAILCRQRALAISTVRSTFDQCLRLLLTFVGTPYFTQESVERERGIIGQEIRM